MFVLLCLATQTPASAGTTEKYQDLNSTILQTGNVIPDIQGASESERNEMLCLALNIYHEARGENARGQWAVGFVTLNRVKRAIWGDSVCAVVWAKSQFSWTIRGMRTLVPREVNAWQEAQRKAYMLFSNQNADDPTDGATNFYLASIHSWTRTLVDRIRIGAHMFARLPN
jgi:N-acetylmuramoyl-L-alanine amidase